MGSWDAEQAKLVPMGILVAKVNALVTKVQYLLTQWCPHEKNWGHAALRVQRNYGPEAEENISTFLCTFPGDHYECSDTVQSQDVLCEDPCNPGNAVIASLVWDFEIDYLRFAGVSLEEIKSLVKAGSGEELSEIPVKVRNEAKTKLLAETFLTAVLGTWPSPAVSQSFSQSSLAPNDSLAAAVGALQS